MRSGLLRTCPRGLRDGQANPFGQDVENKEPKVRDVDLWRQAVKKTITLALLGSILGWSSLVHAQTEAGTSPLVSSVPEELAASPVQDVSTAALLDQMHRLNASGGAVVIISANSGQILALVSATRDGSGSEALMYDRAINRAQETGSVMSSFAVAQALELGLVANEGTMLDTPKSFSVGGRTYEDDAVRAPQMSLEEVFVERIPVGLFQLLKMIGPEQHLAFLADLGFFQPLPLENRAPSDLEPVIPTKSGELIGFTAVLGYGFTSSPLQLATAYAALVNGGMQVTPSFEASAGAKERILSEKTSTIMRYLLRKNVTDGLAWLAEIPEHSIGGKASTVDMRTRGGGFSSEHVVNNFVGFFPADKPQYVIAVLLEDPVAIIEGEEKRTPGWTVVPAATEIIRQVSGSLPFDH